jgi:glycerol-1-phosphate dehydrogenase [NAD(P)+]
MKLIAIPSALRRVTGPDALAAEVRALVARASARRALVVHGGVRSASVARVAASRLGRVSTFAVAHTGFDEVQRLDAAVFASEADVLVAVGGGSVLDVAKLAAHRARIPVLMVPTQATHDGIASPIAVIKAADGHKRSLGASMPSGVVAPLDVIAASSRCALAAGVGDLLSNLSALEDWRLAEARGLEAVDDFAAIVARQAADLVRARLGRFDMADERFVAALIEGLMLSGVAMSITGTSRPCSGSEHLIAHALDFMGLAEARHGTIVGCATLFCLSLQGGLSEGRVRAIRRAGIPIRLEAVAPGSEAVLAEVFSVARMMRPGRYTVLDLHDDSELVAAYHAHVAEMESGP